MKELPTDQTASSGELAVRTGLTDYTRLVSVPWGQDESLELILPNNRIFIDAAIEIAWPDLSHSLADYHGSLEQALDSPIGAKQLEQIVGPGTKVAIVVDDPSRWTPVREALPIVLRRLHRAGVHRDDVIITIGVGRHHAVDAKGMSQRLGDSIAAGYRCYSPPVDDLTAYRDLGSTLQGVPVRGFRPVADADLRVLVGSVLPHLQAGFGGGYKLILPGSSHRTTLGALHRQGLEPTSDPASLLGTHAASNPMRQAIHAAAQRLGPCWSISHLIGHQAQVFRVIAGHPSEVQNLLANEVRNRFHVRSSAPADVIVVGNYPWPGDPMQSFKVLLQHQSACQTGGVLVGLFWTDPDEVDRSFPISALHWIAMTGAAGGWTIRRLLPAVQKSAMTTGSRAAFMLRWARELVVDRTVLVYAPPLYERLGPRLGPVRIFASQIALWHAVSAILSRRRGINRPVRLRVFPMGGLTYCTPSMQSDQ